MLIEKSILVISEWLKIISQVFAGVLYILSCIENRASAETL
jgi:hypothetical protein